MKAQQNNYSKSTLLNLAESAEEYKQYEKAIQYYQEYLSLNPDDWKIQLKFADNLRLNKSYQAAEQAYRKVLDNPKNKNKLASFYYAQLLKMNGKCDLAVPLFTEFRKNYRGEKDDLKFRRLAKAEIEGCQLNNEIAEDQEMHIEALPPSINSRMMESGPVFYQNGLIFASDRPEGNKENLSLESENYTKRQFYYSDYKNGEWNEPKLWALPGMDDYHLMNGAFNFEQTRYYFTACKSNSRFEMDCDLFVFNVKDSSVQRLPNHVNSKYLETQVALGKDEKDRELIYFVSDRKEGKGGKDIWYTRFSEKKQEYREARNCGSKVNSVGDEWTPFIHPRNRVLYFSSDGHPGYGGLDVFKSIGEGSRWDEPENIGAQINNNKDQLYYAEHPLKDYGIYTSNQGPDVQLKESCCDDLYFFQKRNSVLIDFTARVFENEQQNQAISIAQIKVYRVTNEGEKYLEQSHMTNDLGEQKIKLEPGLNYLIRAEKEGYLSEEISFSTLAKKGQSIQETFLLEKISEEAIIIENIYYQFDRSVLTQDAKNTIDTTIYEILVKNPAIIVELSSHTDSKGSKSYNKKLSQSRAESVVKYLVQKGIQKDRLIAKGYGMDKPIAPNKNPDGSDNPQGRAKNRRTEFKIIGKLDEEED